MVAQNPQLFVTTIQAIASENIYFRRLARVAAARASSDILTPRRRLARAGKSSKNRRRESLNSM
jgi:hypothetical protein